MNNPNKRPFIFRAIVAIIVLVVFAISMYPLEERDFFTVLNEKLTYNTNDSSLQLAIQEAHEIVKNSPDTDKIGSAEALIMACDEYGVNLADYVDSSAKVLTTKDVVSVVKMNAAAAIRLGIDIRGGVEYLITLEDLDNEDRSVDTSKQVAMDPREKADKARELIRTRLENAGIFETEISVQQEKFVSIRAPLRSQEEKQSLKRMITQAAKLRFHLVAERELNNTEVAKYEEALRNSNPKSYIPPAGYQMMRTTRTENGKVKAEYYLVQTRYEMTGNDVKKAKVEPHHTTGQPTITLSFGSKGTADFARVTSAYSSQTLGEGRGRLLAIVLDGVLYSAPVLNVPIPDGNAVIEGNFTQEEAEMVANALNSGNLPFKMVVSGEYDVDNTIGDENRTAGMTAGLISVILVMLFMALYYLKSGWIANIALIANIVLVLGALAAFQQTLTLPGIAGVILTIGMAVDANVLINERIREELREGKSIYHAIEAGYSRAFLTIFDSNLTTLIVGLILIWFATGAVKGFAIVLSIGIVTSMFTALFVTRIIFDILARFNRPKSLPMFDLFGLGTRITFNFLGMRKIVTLISLALVIGSFGVFAWRGADALSIDFRGGTQLSYICKDKSLSVAAIEAELAKEKLTQVKVGYKSTSKQNILEIIVGFNQPELQTQPEKYSTMVAGIVQRMSPGFLLPDESTHASFTCDEKKIDGLVGGTFIKAAILSVAMAFLGILIYVALRFEFAYALGASVALLHDVIIASGIFVLLGGEISLTAVAALLTLYGYSINDTIVIFDRVREQHKLHPEQSLYEIINNSINQTLPRTILTSVTVFITVITLLLGGGASLHDFSLIMFFGVIIGTYSSVCVASPIVFWWNKYVGIQYDRASEVDNSPEVAKKHV